MAGTPEQPSAKRWSNPLTVAVVAAALAGFSNAWLAYENNGAQLALETKRAESERILEMLRAGDPARVRENLRFLIQLGLVSDKDLRSRIEGWEANPNRAPAYVLRDELVRAALEAPENQEAEAQPPGSKKSLIDAIGRAGSPEAESQQRAPARARQEPDAY